MTFSFLGLYGFDSYHEMQGWGVDVLKVGDVLGIGTLAFWDGEKVVRVEKTNGILCFVESGKKSSKVVVNYSVELAEELPNMATGIIKSETIKPSKE